MKNSLRTDEFIRRDEYLVAPDSSCFLLMQGDGNLCLYRGTGPSDVRKVAVWCALTEARSPNDYFAIMQGDGNLAVYEGKPESRPHVKFVCGTAPWRLLASGGKFLANVETGDLWPV